MCFLNPHGNNYKSDQARVSGNHSTGGRDELHSTATNHLHENGPARRIYHRPTNNCVVTIVVLLIKLTSNPKIRMWIIPPTVPKMNNNFPVLLEGCRPMAKPMVRMRGIPEVRRSWATIGRPYEPRHLRLHWHGSEVHCELHSLPRFAKGLHELAQVFHICSFFSLI